MTWTAHLLRGADDLVVRPFEPYTTAATFIVDTCGETGVTAYAVLQKFAASDTAFGYRLREGLPAQKYGQVGEGNAWSDLDPQTDFGSMLVRSITVAEHEGRDDLWRVDYEATGFGPALNATNDATIASPNIAVAVASRPNTRNAYRAEDPSGTTPLSFPTEAPAETDTYFDRTDWHTGTDIGGLPVDVNTSPLPVPIDQTVVTITYVVRWHYQQWDGTYSGRTNLEAANAYIGGRNLCEFMQFPIGSLLCESIDVQPLHHEFKLATIVLVYDEWRHAQQVPLTLPQFSTPVLVDTTTAMSQTKTVLWVQPYLDGFCFTEDDGIFAAVQWAYLDQFNAAPADPP